jgi:ankyrin repeat protein
MLLNGWVFFILSAGMFSGCIRTPDEIIVSSIHQALIAGDASSVQKAASDKDQLSMQNEYGETPLIIAVKNRQPEFVDILLANGAEPDQQNPVNGETPVIAAVKNNDKVILNKLLDAGASPDRPDNEGVSPLRWAIRKNYMEMVKALTVKTGTGNSKEISAAVLESAAYGNSEALNYLYSTGAPQNPVSEKNETPMILAARFGHTGIMKQLIDTGGDMDAADVNRACALTWAARMGNADITHMLIQAGAKTELIDTAGFTPLAHAVRLGHSDIVDTLISGKASVSITLPKGSSVMYWAAFQDSIAEKLYSADADITEMGDNEIMPLESALRYLWLARFYEDKFLNKSGNHDHERMVKCYDWAAGFFDKASDQYDATAKNIKNTEMWKKIGMAGLAMAGAWASSVQADMKAKQMAEIGALGQASREGTGVSGYYGALSSRSKTYTPYTTSQLTTSAGNLNTDIGNQSASFYANESNKSRQAANACRKIIDCYKALDTISKDGVDCKKIATDEIRYLN